jgi:hypothetical protein
MLTIPMHLAPFLRAALLSWVNTNTLVKKIMPGNFTVKEQHP